VDALTDNCHQVRIAALEALGRLGDGRAIDALVAALGDRDLRIRLAAAAALSECVRAARAGIPCGADGT
jgi:HEAT repeat protein